MPTSERKAKANRKDSPKPAGPKPEAGKERARADALNHGLSDERILDAPTDAIAVAERMEEWRPEYHVDSPTKESAFEEMVVNSIRIELCKQEVHLIQESEKLRAALAWDIDQEADAAALGDKLRRKPDVVTKQLMKSKHGCEWLLEQWEGLGAALEANGKWTDEQSHRALDLCGVPRAGRGESAKPKDPLAVVNTKCSHLQELIRDRYVRIDGIEHLDAMEGFPRVPNKRIAKILRYEAACLKRMNAAHEMLSGPATKRPS
jgi:hypothetical protein